ncbi:hypothetical protein O3P69_001314 [Scylla paramamosain]|uniref:Uncharacterized protein n=1 Tax=Scylla paramamosain TaxID=85552 RepID=A0AAW0USG5_SCYPA
MYRVPYEVLWCQCQGNASAIPHQQLMHEQVSRMHEVAQQHAVWYVGVVLALYFIGLHAVGHAREAAGRARLAPLWSCDTVGRRWAGGTLVVCFQPVWRVKPHHSGFTPSSVPRWRK